MSGADPAAVRMVTGSSYSVEPGTNTYVDPDISVKLKVSPLACTGAQAHCNSYLHSLYLIGQVGP